MVNDFLPFPEVMIEAIPSCQFAPKNEQFRIKIILIEKNCFSQETLWKSFLCSLANGS